MFNFRLFKRLRSFIHPEKNNEVAPLPDNEQPVASGGGSIKDEGHPEEGRSAHRGGSERTKRRLRKTRKVAPLQKKIMPPVVPKLFETLPKPEKATAEDQLIEPKEEELLIEDIEWA